jgi:hypothetical protein
MQRAKALDLGVDARHFVARGVILQGAEVDAGRDRGGGLDRRRRSGGKNKRQCEEAARHKHCGYL